MQLVKSAQRYDGCDLNYPFGANIVTALDFLTLISYFYIPICNQLILHKLFHFYDYPNTFKYSTVFLKMGSLFCLFCSFRMTNIAQIL